MVCTCNPSTQELEVEGRVGVQNQHELNTGFRVSLGCVARFCLKNPRAWNVAQWGKTGSKLRVGDLACLLLSPEFDPRNSHHIRSLKLSSEHHMCMVAHAYVPLHIYHK